ncbi:unnamed protein product [Zymoseptoria tritici ST99CH_1A5]|uniref:Uncharacterized protein n=1 Tax=Zymoseptoria tritici ST99CH_1A5 TaxID=1276529 RepID=A0A1Y6M0A7_ZYMTR|nr:unnamed protein product [Zymoseptoria tritici ST99CH_1A5]
MNTSNTQTETVDPAGQGSNTKPLGTPDQSQAQTLGSDTLPPPKQDLGEAEREELRSSVEVLADLDKDDAGNHKPHFERDVFEDANFKNGDDLLDRYRTELVDLLKSDAEQRTKAYDVLNRAIHLNGACVYIPVRNQVVQWARDGYQGDCPIQYFNADGSIRDRMTAEDPAFIKRSQDDRRAEKQNRRGSDISMGEADSGISESDFPTDMAYIRERWNRATEPLQKMLDKPSTAGVRGGDLWKLLESLNKEISEKQAEEKKTLDLSIPFLTIMETMKMAVEHLVPFIMKGRAECEQEWGTYKEDGWEMHRLQCEQKQQPAEWFESVKQAITQKCEILLNAGDKDPSNMPELWPTVFKEYSQQNSEQTRDSASNQEPVESEGTKSEHQGSDKNEGSDTPSNSTKRTRVHRVKLKPNHVNYNGSEREIGAVRDCGRTVRGVRVPLWQVLVQVSEDDAPFRIWHIVPSYKLAPGVVERYRNRGHGRVLGEMQGKPGDIDATSIDNFNWGGLAFMPRETEYRAPIQYVLGSIGKEEDFDKDCKFWTRSLLGKVFRQKFVDDEIAKFVKMSSCQPPPQPWGRQAISGNGFSGTRYGNSGEDLTGASDVELDENDGVYENEDEDDFIAPDSDSARSDRAKSFKARPKQSEPKRSEPKRSEPKRSEPKRSEPKRSEPGIADVLAAIAQMTERLVRVESRVGV